MRAATIRSLQHHLWLIDEEFRQNPRHHRLFLEILREPEGVTRAFRRMNLYGVLGRYMPAFGRIVGRMQYDLFHAYTVDAHTLFVRQQPATLRARALRPRVPEDGGAVHARCRGRRSPTSRPCSTTSPRAAAATIPSSAPSTPRPSASSRACRATTRAWSRGWCATTCILSITAQKQDITDPEVINEFARRVGDPTHLDYLYVLTVADVRGTNPKLWNTWKASLFEEFYERTRRALRRGLESPLGEAELIAETQAEAREILARDGVPVSEVERVWKTLTGVYFLRHTAEEIAWHTSLLAGRDPFDEEPLVAVRQETARGGTAIFSYTQRRQHSFARATAVLDQMGLTILDARITPTANGFSVETYLVLEDTGGAISERTRIHEIEQGLLQEPARGRRLHRHRHAPRAAPGADVHDPDADQLEPTTSATSAPCSSWSPPTGRGCCRRSARCSRASACELLGARIVTVGERAEDVFYVADGEGRPLDAAARGRVEAALRSALDLRA